MRDQALAYMKQCLMNDNDPESKLPDDPIERERIWDEMPNKYKDKFVDMILGFGNGSGSPVLSEIMAEYNKKSHSDMSFGMTVKQIISKKR
jgi:hypothetical protein